MFNPVGVNQFLGANGQPITATSVSGQLNQAYPDECAGFRGSCNRGCTCSGPSVSTRANGAASAYIKRPPTTSGGQTVITLNQPLAGPVTNDRVVFSQVPYLAIMQNTSGEMVFGNTGFFADTLEQGLPEQ